MIVRIQMDEMKRRILSFAMKAERPLTTQYVSEEFNLCYTTSQRILFDLAIEGYLKLISTKTWAREFLPEKDRILRDFKIDDELTILKR